MKKLPFIVFLVASSCAPLPSSDTPGQPAPLVLATFTGEVDQVAGTFTVRSEPTALGWALGASSLTIESGTPGVTVANSGTVWNGEPGHCSGPGLSTGAPVAVTSNFSSPTILLHVYAQIDVVTPPSASSCNSETGTVIPGVTADDGGLWYYGTLTAGQTRSTPWAFTFVSATRSTFRGRIVAFRFDTWTDHIVGTHVDQTQQSYMAGSSTAAVFVDEVNRNRVTIVDAAGGTTLSQTVGGAISSVATNADGSRIWLVLGAERKLALLNSAGTLQGEYSVAAVTGSATPGYSAVDPRSGTVWFHLAGGTGVGWFDPSNSTQGFVSTTEEVGQPVVAVDSGSACLLYVGYYFGPLKRINCTTKSDVVVITPSASAPGCSVGSDMVAGAGGDVWYRYGDRICKVSPGGTTVTSEVTLASGNYSGLAYTDGSLWAMTGSGLRRIWLGTPLYAVTSIDSTATGWGLVAGAGSVWAPAPGATIGQSNLLRVTP